MEIYNFIIGVPFTGVVLKSEIPATREDEAVAIAAGAWLAGKTPLVFMQNSGLGLCVDVITSLLKPYRIKVHFRINNRQEPDHHAFMASILFKLINLLGLYDASIGN